MNNGTEVYLSVDIEADGPIPGPYSMVSLGASVACWRTPEGLVGSFAVDEPENQFYVEMKPISEKWDQKALDVSGLSRAHLLENGQYPHEAMTSFAQWVQGIKARPGVGSVVFAAYPLGFDWTFTYWYLMNFADGGSPFGHSTHIDIKTLYAARGDKLIRESIKRRMPKSLMSKRRHTHNALDDAIEQGELLTNLLRWEPARD